MQQQQFRISGWHDIVIKKKINFVFYLNIEIKEKKKTQMTEWTTDHFFFFFFSYTKRKKEVKIKQKKKNKTKIVVWCGDGSTQKRVDPERDDAESI